MISTEVFMDIISLHRQGLSMRAIAKKLGIHRNTVKKHIEGNTLPQYRKKKRQKSILDPYRQVIDDYLAEDDYRATWILDRIRNMGYTGSYETLRDYVRKVKERHSRLAYARFETEPGRQAQVDWGDLQVENPDGSFSTKYMFLMILGYSRAMYIEFVNQCTLETFLDCHIRAFHYLQGVPAEILYDNMKQVVTGRKQGKAVFNTEFLHFARHYNFTPRACPPYSPWVKGKAERPMDYVRQRFWRGYVYTSLEKLNRDAALWLDKTANSRRHGTHGQRIYERWQQELAALTSLPPSDYDTSIKIYRKVYKDCQISYNGNRYLVPYKMVGKKVMLKIKHRRILIYDDNVLLASYEEARGKNELIGNRLFYEQLKRDRQLVKRKYGRRKGKATRGLTTSSLFPQVEYRPLAEYERYAQGGGSWNS
ncbi:IS21 family transposase [Desulfolithobacter dissulfuricans]|uniref:IS21 family transposase n=2 Tax=Desulfolithobacter dissulfuricans TaxID=2795293 RepID=A0A915U4N1_9BACT|nr:IS21 family transposase [Desulfolithobacter dissulfuricans]